MAKYILQCEENGDLYVVEDEATFEEGIIEVDADGNLYYTGEYPFGGSNVQSRYRQQDLSNKR